MDKGMERTARSPAESRLDVGGFHGARPALVLVLVQFGGLGQRTQWHIAVLRNPLADFRRLDCADDVLRQLGDDVRRRPAV